MLLGQHISGGGECMSQEGEGGEGNEGGQEEEGEGEKERRKC